MYSPEDVLNFWFYEVGRDKWFAHDDAVDSLIRERFLAEYERAISGELKKWEATPEGTLALLLLLDEFPRHMFRDSPRAFEASDVALELARDAIINHFDDRIDRQFKLIFYLPFLNSENIGDQRLALFYIRERAKDDEWLAKAEENHEIIRHYGRFPQRDALLGRTCSESTAAGKSS